MVKEGGSALIEQIERWIDGGISNEELKAKKDTILGTYKVSFGTTSGIATQILINKERGREKKYLDQYPKDIMAVSRGNVNSSIQRYCNTGKMLSVAAGSVNDKWEPLS